jgi:hypothetical protein
VGAQACTRGYVGLRVAVQWAGGTFQLGSAQASALLRFERGRTEQVQDSADVRDMPTVFMGVADTGRLDGAGVVTIDVTYGCPVGSIPAPSNARVAQGQVSGGASFVPVCDRVQHTLSVQVESTSGLFQPGPAWASAIGQVTDAGDVFYGQAPGDRHQGELSSMRSAASVLRQRYGACSASRGSSSSTAMAM